MDQMSRKQHIIVFALLVITWLALTICAFILLLIDDKSGLRLVVHILWVIIINPVLAGYSYFIVRRFRMENIREVHRGK